MGGKEFPIQLDTGSSDVWVQTPFELELTNTTDLNTTLTFGIGQASGNVAFADLQFGPHKVPGQGTSHSLLVSSNALRISRSFLECHERHEL